ncbi:unnamed protein product [Boreogadus saida]
MMSGYCNTEILVLYRLPPPPEGDITPPCSCAIRRFMLPRPIWSSERQQVAPSTGDRPAFPRAPGQLARLPAAREVQPSSLTVMPSDSHMCGTEGGECLDQAGRTGTSNGSTGGPEWETRGDRSDGGMVTVLLHPIMICAVQMEAAASALSCCTAGARSSAPPGGPPGSLQPGDGVGQTPEPLPPSEPEEGCTPPPQTPGQGGLQADTMAETHVDRSVHSPGPSGYQTPPPP